VRCFDLTDLLRPPCCSPAARLQDRGAGNATTGSGDPGQHVWNERFGETREAGGGTSAKASWKDSQAATATMSDIAGIGGKSA
jgi:hypothetical protein